MSLAQYEAEIATDFLVKLRDLVAIFGARLSARGQQQQRLLEAAGDELAVEIFQKTRKLIWQCAAAVAGRDVQALTAAAAAQAQVSGEHGQEALDEALRLWETAARKDKRTAFALADGLVADVREWQEMGGGL